MDTVKRVGRYSVPVELFSDVVASLSIVVAPEGQEVPTVAEIEAAEADAATAEAALAAAAAAETAAAEAAIEVAAEEAEEADEVEPEPSDEAGTFAGDEEPPA